MASVSASPKRRKASVRPLSLPLLTHRESILLFGAKSTRFYDAPDLPVGAAVHEKGVIIGKGATAEDVGEALWLYLKGVTGFRGNSARMLPMLTVVARRRMRMFGHGKGGSR